MYNYTDLGRGNQEETGRNCGEVGSDDWQKSVFSLRDSPGDDVCCSNSNRRPSTLGSTVGDGRIGKACRGGKASSSSNVHVGEPIFSELLYHSLIFAEKLISYSPTQAAVQAGKKKAPMPEPAPQGAGLKMAAHPLLLDRSSPAPQSKKDKYKPMVPKFASIKVLFLFCLNEMLALSERQ